MFPNSSYIQQFFTDIDPDDLRNVVLSQSQAVDQQQKSFVVVDELAHITPDVGDGELRIYKAGSDALRIIISADDIFDELGVHAQFAALDDNGVAKVYIDADLGTIYAEDAVISGTITVGAGSQAGGWLINADTITDAAGVVGLSSAVTGGDDIRFWAGDATPGNAEFRVTKSGVLVASSATITGDITATSGVIGGFTIGTNSLITTLAGIHSAAYSEGAEILLGHATAYASAKIGLKADGSGKLASGNISWDTSGNTAFAGEITSTATITGGTIQTASSGARVVINLSGMSAYDATTQRAFIGSDGSGWFGASNIFSWTTAGAVTLSGWSAQSNILQNLSSNIGIKLDAGNRVISVGNLAGTYIKIDGANQVIESSNYSAGLVGSSWATSSGNAEFNNVTVRGAIRSAVVQYNQIMATAGTQLIVPSAGKLKSDVAVPASPTYGTTTVTVDIEDQDGISHAASGTLFAVNDIIYIKDGFLGYTYFKITATSDQTTFWRYTASIQAGTNDITYRAGGAVMNYKQSGAGGIMLTSDLANAPYLQMFTHAGTFSSADASGALNLTQLIRAGNLNGSYGYSSDVYGFATGQYGAASKGWLTLEQTNGLRIGSNTTVLGQWDTSGNIIVGQVASGKSNVYISGGALKLRNNTTDVIVFDTSESRIENLLKMSGASAALSIGNTPPTDSTHGTGLWVDRTGVYSLSSNVQQATLTSAGLLAGAGKVIANAGGITFSAGVYPSSAYATWRADDNNAIVAQILGTYGGAATNSGLVLDGQAHDATKTGFVHLRTLDENQVTKTSFTLSPAFGAQFNFLDNNVTATGSGYVQIKTKTSSTNTLIPTLNLLVRSTGTTTAGFGNSVEFFGQDSAGNDQQIGWLGMNYTDTTNGSEDANFAIGLQVAGSLATLFQVNGTSGNYNFTDNPMAANNKGLTIFTKITNTNVPNNAFSLVTRSTGTAASGLGTAMSYYIQNSAGADKQAGYTAVSWDDTTSGSEDANFGIALQVAGSLTTLLQLNGTSGLSLTGNLAINTNKFTVAASSGNTAVGGTLAVTGVATFNGNVTLGDAAGDTITFTGTPAGLITSGTYTPTLTNVTNVAASTAQVCQYMRVGNVVTVSGAATMNPTATGITELGVSFPIASALTAAQQCGGTFGHHSVAGNIGIVAGDVTNNRARFLINVQDLANRSYYFTFTYQVV